jgi:hypothetical protein
VQNRTNVQTEAHPTRAGWTITIWQDVWGVWCYEAVGPTRKWWENGFRRAKQARERAVEVISMEKGA